MALLIGEIMRYLEVRRHSKRERPQQHLSAWGNFSSYCEGVKLGFSTTDVTTIELLRIQY